MTAPSGVSHVQWDAFGASRLCLADVPIVPAV